MNVQEERARTLSFQLIERLQARGRIQSMVLFTGTPHRGNDYGFLSLLKLLRPEDFDPRESLEAQVHKLRNVMIRNNKHRVTDMVGTSLFTPVISRRETYSYSPEEARLTGASRSSSRQAKPTPPAWANSSSGWSSSS